MNQSSSVHLFLKGIILFGFGMMFLGMITTGNIIYYIAPTMMPFIYFALIVFMLLSVVLIVKSMSTESTASDDHEHCDHGCEGHHHASSSTWKTMAVYGIFLVPLLAGFVIPDRELDSSVASMRGVQIGGGVYSNQVETGGVAASVVEDTNPDQSQVLAAPTEDDGDAAEREGKTSDEYLADLESSLNKENGTNQEGLEGGTSEPSANGNPDLNANAELNEDEHITYDELLMDIDYDEYYGNLLQESQQDDLIVIDDDNFLDMMTIVDMHLDELEGQEVQLMGFVYREEGIAENEAVVARFSMTCCTADSAVYGLLVKGAEINQYDMDEWVQIRGTLTKAHFGDWEIPAIDLNSVEQVDGPDSPYVYPSFGW